MAQNIERELNEQISQLPAEQQLRVLDFARSLAGALENRTNGHALLAHAGTIDIDDLALMKQAIEKDCETINSDEW
ncbi:MAG: hypothetical protein WAM70_16985 [Pyrinomonadaceae bacterium]